MIEKAKAGIQLKSIMLVDSMFTRGGYLDIPNINEQEMRIQVGGGERNDKFIDCSVLVELGEINNKDKFAFAVNMIGIFEKTSDFPLSIDEFCKINAASIIFPYIRQHIRSLSLDAGLAPIILPLVNFQKMYELDKEKSQDA